MNDDNDKLPGWTAQARQALDESAQNLDAATLSRLNRARQRALEKAHPGARTWFLPAGLAGACAVLLVVALVWQRPTRVPSAGPDPFIAGPGTPAGGNGFSANDLELVSSDDGIEFYQDLDFYAWLDSQGGDNNG